MQIVTTEAGPMLAFDEVGIIVAVGFWFITALFGALVIAHVQRTSP